MLLGRECEVVRWWWAMHLTVLGSGLRGPVRWGGRGEPRLLLDAGLRARQLGGLRCRWRGHVRDWKKVERLRRIPLLPIA
jgi:hypothetical protein